MCRGRRDNGSHLPDFHRLEHQRDRKKLREIDRLVSDKYVGELDADNVADYAAAGYITGLGDKWSSYIPAENYEAYRMSGEGKGCGIGVSVTSTETSIRVTLVYDDSPAAKAGIEKGDYILGTGDLTTEKDGSSAVISAISGKEGTDVTVTVKKADGSAKGADHAACRCHAEDGMGKNAE